MCQTVPLHEMTDEYIQEKNREPFLSQADEEMLMLLDLKRRQRVENNRKRAFNMSRSVRQNQIAYFQLDSYLQEVDRDFTPEEQVVLTSYRRSIGSCCQLSLWREHEGNALEFIAAHTCKHKYCNVCNARRCKEIRKRYRLLFEKDPQLLENYDFMHLTLTVPHTEAGWMGKNWYAETLMKKFNLMRKRSWWKNSVYAGEFGVETTKNQNGLHIHIHSLLLVRKAQGNRNELHRNVLIEWNKLTTWSGANRQKLDDKAKAAILKSNKTISELDVDMLNPQGATMIGLENVYLRSERKQRGYMWNESVGAWIKRVSYKRDGQDSFMNAIMECIKYHFEPSGMQANGTADIELMIEILPEMKGKPLYRKFGAFHAGTKDAHEFASMLNYNSNLDDFEAIEEEIELNANSEVLHPETGEIVERDSYKYMVVPMNKVWFDASRDYKPRLSHRVKRRYIPDAFTMREALMEMLYLSIDRATSANRRGIYSVNHKRA